MMSRMLLRLRENGKAVIFQNVSLLRFRLFCIIGAFSSVQTFSAKADFAPETLGFRNDVLSGEVAASRAPMNGLGSDGALSPTQTSADRVGTDIQNSIKSEESEGELPPLWEGRIGIVILGGLALLLWVQRLRS